MNNFHHRDAETQRNMGKGGIRLCYAQPMPLRLREPDAIDLWFAMQRKGGWKKWRWLVVVMAIILICHTFSFSFYPGVFWIYALPPVGYDPNLLSSGDYEFWLRLHYHLHDGLIIPAVFIPLTLAGACTFPNELIAAVGLNKLMKRKKQLVRKASWLMFGLLYFAPMLSSVIFPGLWSVEALPFHLILVCWLVVFLAISESVVFVSTCQLDNWVVGLSVVGVMAVFILFRLYFFDTVQGFLNSPIGIIDANIIWFALKPIAIAALVSLVALVFLFRANQAPAEYQADR